MRGKGWLLTVALAVAGASAFSAHVAPATQAAGQQNVNAEAAILADFQARVKKYMAIHADAARGTAKLQQTDNPEELSRAQEALAERIRTARASAKQGDIFTGEIRDKFRRLLAPELKGQDGRDAKALLKEDAPAEAAIPFKVNAKYPDDQPKPTVPASFLQNLPKLPEPLEYRVIGNHLVLLDGGANVIVDYIPNAVGIK